MAKDTFMSVITAEFQASPQKLSDTAAEWLQGVRKISRTTLAKLPVASGMVHFRNLNGKSDAVFFRYPTGWKARSYPQKEFSSKVGTKASFWNIEAVLKGPLDVVYITEGELDACALVESGISHDRVLSVHSGNGGKDGLEYVGEALKAGLSDVKRFLWCGDQDETGLNTRQLMASLIGAARFTYVEFPDGIKDPNDYLMKDGASGAKNLHDLVTFGYLYWPAEGLFKLKEVPDSPLLTPWSLGFDGWQDNAISVAPRTLSVVTGFPGSGKTALWAQLWYQVIAKQELANNHIVACIATFETRPKPHFQRILRQLHGRKRSENFLDSERANTDKWLDDHYRFIIHKEGRADLAWTLGQAEIAVVRDGARILQIDPWNRLEASRDSSKETETDYIGRCLRVLYNFAVDFNCHVQVLAHPAKADNRRRGMMPELEDISGSAHWFNMVDQGFVVHRPKLFDDDGNRVTYAELHHKKARFEELGYPSKFGLEYDVERGRYWTCALKVKKKSNGSFGGNFDPADDDQQASLEDNLK